MEGPEISAVQGKFFTKVMRLSVQNTIATGFFRLGWGNEWILEPMYLTGKDNRPSSLLHVTYETLVSSQKVEKLTDNVKLRSNM